MRLASSALLLVSALGLPPTFLPISYFKKIELKHLVMEFLQ
jgi:hypothetical protein